MQERGKILWADDELQFLRAHIMYLEQKGFSVKAVNSGEDALVSLEQESFDLVLLDEMMSGMDGITTLKRIKEIAPGLPVIMVTKNEEEAVMDEAIGQQSANYLTKPVNPSQVFIACKNELEKQAIRSDSATRNYLADFQQISNDINYAASVEDWYRIIDKLTNWELEFDRFGDPALRDLILEQKQEANQQFSQFFIRNYPDWVRDLEGPKFTPDIVPQWVIPALKRGEKVVLLILDCMRMDQWKAISQTLFSQFDIRTEQIMAILPSSTPYSRNAIFAGMYPQDIQQKYPDKWSKMFETEKNMNRFEELFLRDQLNRAGLHDKSMSYRKIISFEDGSKLDGHLSEFKSMDLLAIVINFIDLLGHSRSESLVLKEMLPDEQGYRKSVQNWADSSWMRGVFEELSTWEHKVVVSSDHGTTRVNRAEKVKADRDASSGVRYKTGRNLRPSNKSALLIQKPERYRLPQTQFNYDYIVAKGDYFFVYPNEYHHFVSRYQSSFQHGGISMEELVLPLAVMQGKK